MGKGTAAGNSIYRSSVVSLVLLPRKKPHCTLMNDWEVPKNLHFHLFLIIWYTSPNIPPPHVGRYSCDEGPNKHDAFNQLPLPLPWKVTQYVIPNIAHWLLVEIFYRTLLTPQWFSWPLEMNSAVLWLTGTPVTLSLCPESRPWGLCTCGLPLGIL